MAIAIDPEYSASFSAESLGGIAVPVAVINLAGAAPAGLDASTLASASPRIAYAALPDATRFSVFSLCKPKGAAILAEEGGDDAICRDETAEDRRRIHDELAALIAGQLREKLRVVP